MRDNIRLPAMPAVAGLAFAVLAGCAAEGPAPDRPPLSPRQTAAATKGADWSKAESLTVTLSDFAFEPERLTFRRGTAYRLVLRNPDSGRHTFAAPGFFNAVATRTPVRDGTVAVPPGGEKTLYLVPVRRGTYALECSVFLHVSFGMDGSVVVR